MNGKGKEFADAIVREVESWPGVTVAFVEGGPHPKAKFTFNGKVLSRPFSGTHGIAIRQMLGDMRRIMRQLGAVRDKPEPTAEEEEALYNPPNPGRDLRPDPVRREPVVQTDPKDPLRQLAAANPVESTLPATAGRIAIAEPLGWLGVGEHDIDGERYHADPCEMPSLSASIAKVMIERSPWHAWTKHPRLNPDYEETDKAIYRSGRAFHAMLLGKGAPIEVFDYRDWKTGAAKADKAAALEAGYTPLLTHQFAELEAMVRSVKRQVRAREELAYAMAGGTPERVFIWQEDTPSGPIWCRMMADWTPHSGRYAVDWKSTGVSAGPNGWGSKTMWDSGCDIQDAFYRRGYKAVLGRDFDALIFAVAETEAPYAMMHHRVDPEAQDQADRMVQWAINAWAMCQHRNRWPGYPVEMAWQTKPGWRSMNHDAAHAAGAFDAALLEERIENFKLIAAMPKDAAGGVAIDDEHNPFGLDPIEGEQS